MRLYSNNATSDYNIQRINTHFLCNGVVGLKLAPPLIQEKNNNIKVLIQLYLFNLMVLVQLIVTSI